MRTIFLIGFMGCGKTTVGRLLAEELGLGFIDTDLEIENKAQKSISGIFLEEGEKRFRELETSLITELAGKEVVVATGGGAILKEMNRQTMKKTGIVIFLEASEEEIAKRLANDESRPLLAGDKQKEIKERLAARLPLYHAASHTQIPVDGKSPETIVKEIAGWLKQA
ncbi:shikimate kinase [Bacillus sp. EB01]|uniref:shikimate kinase n=1 Tax=Bacillus sp. EB01 TaxID=1347086 RepID=UPI0005C4E8BF|nr:shikimate kinase [Bacillus sp. EB01]